MRAASLSPTIYNSAPEPRASHFPDISANVVNHDHYSKTPSDPGGDKAGRPSTEQNPETEPGDNHLNVLSSGTFPKRQLQGTERYRAASPDNYTSVFRGSFPATH